MRQSEWLYRGWDRGGQDRDRVEAGDCSKGTPLEMGMDMGQNS
jgi:hypothetical protein